MRKTAASFFRFTSLLAAVSLGLGCSGAEDDQSGLAASESNQTAAPCAVRFDVRSSWGSGYVADVSVTTVRARQGWTLGFDFASGEKLNNLWNGEGTQSGARVSVRNASYNADVPAAGTISLGFTADGVGSPNAIKNFTLDGETCSVNGVGGSPGSKPSPEPKPAPQPGPEPKPSPVPPAPPSPPSSNPSPSAPGYLHTSGAKIVDSKGAEVRLTGINWFGMETDLFVPHGLWARPMDAYLDAVKSLGYNMLRIPYTNAMLRPSARVSNGLDANPQLRGKTPLEVLDLIVRGAEARGIRIVLDRHRPEPTGQSNLWYTGSVSEKQWIDDWKFLAEHYKGNPTVVGVDLHNEPHGEATWGDGNLGTDWRLAAERAGAAIQAVNPNLLIIVEGVERAMNAGGWWGGNLRGVATAPVRLPVADRIVYSPHEYPSTVASQPWFQAGDYPNNLPKVWDDSWGYIVKQNIAPIWIGEFGTKLETQSDRQWMQKLVGYIKDTKMSFAFWCLNPNSGDTGGILRDNWQDVQQEKQTIISPALAPFLP
jgi:aryl-phospho-beta-D-glucosidase BglC (GH1 family)